VNILGVFVGQQGVHAFCPTTVSYQNDSRHLQPNK
jgi:hypothetical protein